jgi:8-oxo-dGTP pyrophosphatase MutT (NUDIX family)
MTKALLKPKSISETIYDIVSSIVPFDDLEASHREDTLAWIQRGETLFRIKKPDVPKKHLVSYFVLFDVDASKILLVDHKKAQLWLPSGGHVEVDEDPMETVKRECFEELGIRADFLYPHPLFITSTITVGLTAGHTDVSLWYVLRGDHNHPYIFDREEFNNIKWFNFTEIPYEKSDPHLQRFVHKLTGK